jgi:hypothetical protein
MLAAMMTAVVLLSPPASSEPAFSLPGYVTDSAGALNSTQLGEVQQAVDKLYKERRIRLWVVYVKSFGTQSAVAWTQTTRTLSDLGNEDAVLAVATGQRSYAFLVPSATGLSSTTVDDLRRDRIEPALHDSDWAGAAVAAATGLDPAATGASGSGVSWLWLAVILGLIMFGLGGLLLWSRARNRKRRAAEFAVAQRLDPTDPVALASVPLDALDDLSKSIVVDVDNAVRTSDNELTLAIDEFGKQQTEPFAKAVETAKATLAQAFAVRHQLDDSIPETPVQRRDLLTRVVVSAARANRELGAQTDAFHQLRDLVINAPERLDALTQQLVDITARLEPASQELAALHNDFADTALASISRNVNAAKERLAFADESITRSRALVAKPAVGRQGELIDCIRAAQSALGQAGSMLDAIDSAASDIRRAVSTLPSSIADTQKGIEQANAQLAQGGIAESAALTAARDAATKAVANAQANGVADPLGAFTSLTQADAELDRLLVEVSEEREAAQRLARSFDHALFTAQSRVRSVSDYIDTRRGSIGPEARTRLSEAVRHLQAAQDKKKTNISDAIAHANGAATLAAQAQELANNDVMAAQRSYTDRYGGPGSNGSNMGGSNMGAVIGGIILGNILSGGMRGGFGGGGWTTSSYGGTSGPPSDGGMLGGGGRF